VLDGRVVVGLTATELERFTPERPQARPRDLAPCAVQGASARRPWADPHGGGRVGIRFMGTGGLGGVHRGFPTRRTCSADLGACARVRGADRLVGREVAPRRAGDA
jgi:pseudouridine-5'-phosphate glycosidase